jgi:hypothetical protein
MDVSDKVRDLSREIEAQMRSYRKQLQDLMAEAEENDEEIGLRVRKMYVNISKTLLMASSTKA